MGRTACLKGRKSVSAKWHFPHRVRLKSLELSALLARKPHGHWGVCYTIATWQTFSVGLAFEFLDEDHEVAGVLVGGLRCLLPSGAD